MTDILDTDIAVIGAGTAGLTTFHELRRAVTCFLDMFQLPVTGHS